MQQEILIYILKEEKKCLAKLLSSAMHRGTLALFLETRKNKDKRKKREADPLKSRKKVIDKILFCVLK